ncbi:mitomycin antibiotics/polyketide fumonisin biosynthesis protein [Nitzschia inconspicua]|uniref:Mitomycin antibiotics/polyketide fumonisin biosynthesis protein n=1 Tax=Nitzschia inconspicua TaxID=303405 RepID=A0A9K3PJL6_9STRA|nr:mitomycin antibiotics/polyketide fumonisin biosynthesis protein [Nitzschia inconspicua]
MAGNDVHQKSDYASYDTFSFAIPLVESDSDDFPTTSFRQQVPKISDSVVQSFRSNGFIVCPNVITRAAVDALNDRLEEVLRGIYDRGQKPDKIPRILKGNKPRIPSADCNSSNTNEKTRKRGTSIGPLGFSGNLQNVKVLQIINIHKADSLFRKLETNGSLAKIVAQLAGWDAGARLAQDQVWAKPPGAPPLVFHRDSPYFMFEPSDVVTVWIALDDMDPDVGPLEYVIGSHIWGDGRVGSAQQFFHSNVKSLLKSAAEREGLEVDELEIVSMAGLKAGGLSIHHGKIWHGSGKNSSTTRPRRGLGLHFVPANVRFTKDAANSSIWKSYVSNFDDPSLVELSREDFPLSY